MRCCRCGGRRPSSAGGSELDLVGTIHARRDGDARLQHNVSTLDSPMGTRNEDHPSVWVASRRPRTHLEQVAITAVILNGNRRICTVGGIGVPDSADIHANANSLTVHLREISHGRLRRPRRRERKVLDVRWVLDEGDQDDDCSKAPRSV